MKTNNYEKKELITFITIILLIIELIIGGFLFKYKVYKYKKITGIITNNNIVSLIIDKKDKKLLNSNKKVYLYNKVVEYSIIEDRGLIIKKNNKKYYEILINIKTPKQKKTNEFIEFSIKTRKVRIMKLLKQIWEGD